MHLLFNHMLVLRVIRIQHPNRLPPALALCCIIPLDSKTREERRQRRSLRIHTRLHEFLRPAQVAVAVDGAPRAGHGGNPEAEEKRVAIFIGPVFCALEPGFVGFVEGVAFLLALLLALLLRRVFDVIGRRGAVGGDDGCRVGC